MVSRYWFKPKRYGWGATPVSVEGWLLTVGFIGWVVYFFNRSMPAAVIGGVIFVFVMHARTDGEWKWRWGRKE